MMQKGHSEDRWRVPWVGAILAGLFLLLMAAIYNHPMLRSPGSRLDHLGDPALSAWILKWNLHAFFTDPLGIFNANIYYPHRLSLAFSENMIAPSLLLIPFHFFDASPALLYNASFLMGLVLSGLAGYLLAHYLTRSRLLSLIPAIALSFAPFLQAHHGHLQMQQVYWLPLLFLFQYLYFDKLARRAKSRYAMLAAGSICIGALFLSNGYYFIFASTVLPLFQIYRIYRSPRETRLRAALELGAFWLLAALLLLPFVWPYLALRHSLGLERGIEEVKYFSADLLSFLAYNHGNMWFGEATAGRFGLSPEQVLSPGMVLLMCAVLPLLAASKMRSRIARLIASYKHIPRYFIAIDALMILMLLMLGFLFAGHDFVWLRDGEIVELLGVKMKMTRPGNTVKYLLVLLLLRAGLSWRCGYLRRIRLEREQSIYLIIAAFAFLMALGPGISFAGQHLARGPYSLFFDYVPGYSGLRVPARFGIIIVFALSIVAALNLAGLCARMKSSRTRFFVSALIPLLMLCEYYSHPRVPRYAPQEREVDVWLRTAPAGNVLELPLPSYPSDFMRDIGSVYQSCYHWKPLFNGYSGYSPPGYHVVAYYMQSFPSRRAQRILNLLEIDYLILPRHENLDPEQIEKNFQVEAELAKHLVLRPRHADTPEASTRHQRAHCKLPSSAWSLADASVEHSGEFENLQDGDLSSYWHSNAPQKTGDEISIALAKPCSVSGINLYLGTKTVLFPRRFALEYMGSGRQWHDLAYHYDPLDFIASIYANPRESRMSIRFAATDMLALRLRLAESARESSLGFAEIELTTRPMP